ncbi:THUMP domain-containing class I SAM-dependent RNA methyltransferase [Rhodosalinus sediminis]|uniref:THUMP domain-containing class I SAM-dependent RNA methyltransferase n=1 Tax=Rhodosalinus sediminis TaxID=1940533 RepID=UPI0023527597|nr:class I SAM-dependent RNA methyltransferase [Rhodosalinus sediminis]
MDRSFDIFLAAPPGLEPVLAEEARAAGLPLPEVQPGGVALRGGWAEVQRANLELRGASRVLARIGGFPVFHLAQLDKRARKIDWRAVFRADVPVKVETVCRRSKVYHDRAAAARIAGALEAAGVPLGDGGVRLSARIEDNFCTLSVDTSGAPLHRRGHKQAVGKAPLRETMAALFLRACGFAGAEPVVDPMCGSGTFVIEAAEMATGRAPGRARAFAFERLAGFDAEGWAALKAAQRPGETELRFHGSDRDAGAVRMATENAARAGVEGVARFARQAVSDLARPAGPPGLVMVNPPYGGRVGEAKALFALYGALGTVLRERFAGWRVGLVTSDAALARATGLSLEPGPPVPHGGLKVRLYQSGPL